MSIKKTEAHLRLGRSYQSDLPDLIHHLALTVNHFYPFTAPAVRPATIRRWKTKTSTISGILAMMPAAMISPNGTCWENWAGKLAMMTGSVRASGSTDV